MKVPGFLLGCDPEFSYLLSSELEGGTVGFPILQYVLHSGAFGRESSTCGEIRPKPHNNPLVVTARIHRILKEGYDNLPQLRVAKWVAGGDNGVGPCGGHIHLSCKMRFDYDLLVHSLDRTLLYGWDRVLANPIQRNKRRTNGGYGHAGDYRWRRNGTHLEYRGCSSWLVNPKATLAVLTLAKLTFYLVIKEEYSATPHVNKLPSQRDTIQSSIKKLSTIRSLLRSDFPRDCIVGWNILLELLDKKLLY